MFSAVLFADSIRVSVVGIIIGLLLAALIYFVCEWLAARSGAAVLRIIGAIVAVLVFLVCAFDWVG